MLIGKTTFKDTKYKNSFLTLKLEQGLTEYWFPYQRVHQHADQKHLLYHDTVPFQLAKSDLDSQISGEKNIKHVVFVQITPHVA